MTKKFFFLVVAILMGGMTAVKAKINYVPLYIIDTHADVRTVKRTPAVQLFITQDDHKLILPEFEPEDSLTIFLIKDNEWVYSMPYHCYQPIVYLPTTLVGDFEIRICGDTYYYYGFLTLEGQKSSDIPTENANWDNIKLLGSDTSQQFILDNILGLHVVEYIMKTIGGYSSESLNYLSEEEKEAYMKTLEEMNAERRSQLRYGLLPEELRAIFPSLVLDDAFTGGFAINYIDLIPILISCIQELKTQLDARTQTIVDVMMSRGIGTSAVSEVRAAIGNTLLSVSPSSVSESAQVRYILGDDASNAFIAVTDMGGRVMTRVPVSPIETSATIDSGILGEGIFLCTLYVDGKNVGTKRLVKTR